MDIWNPGIQGSPRNPGELIRWHWDEYGSSSLNLGTAIQHILFDAGPNEVYKFGKNVLGRDLLHLTHGYYQTYHLWQGEKRRY
jgi:hypothetical protein